MKVLITGGGGFIGSHLAQSLLKTGYDVVVLDRKTQLSLSGIEVVEGDIADPATWKCVPRCDFVFHAAASVSAVESEKDPMADFNTNVVGTHYLAQYAEQYGAGVIFCRRIATSLLVQHLFLYNGWDEYQLPLRLPGAHARCGHARPRRPRRHYAHD